MSILGALGGIGRGVSAGVQDLERMEAAKRQKELAEFAKLQQGRQKQEWEQEDAATARLAAVPTKQAGWSGSYSEAAARGMPTRDDDGNTMPGVSQVARSREDVLNEQADAVAGAGGFRNLQRADQLRAQVLGIQDRNLAADDRGRRIKQEDLAAKDRDVKRRQDEYTRNALRAWGLAQNPGTSRGALEMMVGSYNSHVNDGMQAVYDPEANTIGFAKGGKFVYPPIPATHDVIKDLVGNSLRFSTPEMMGVFMKNDVASRAVDNDVAATTGRNENQTVANQISRDELKAKIDAGHFNPRLRSEGGGNNDPRVVSNPDGGFLALDKKTGQPLFGITGDGRRTPLGWDRTVSEAKKAGVVADYDATGRVAYKGRDGWYSSIAEAQAANKRK